jgi:hypothetical protein
MANLETVPGFRTNLEECSMQDSGPTCRNVARFRANLEECRRTYGHLGGMWEDSGPSWRNVAGFRANLEECSRIQGQIIP